MAEQFGLNKLLADIEKASRNIVLGGMGVAQGVGQSVDNFGRFFRSEKEVKPNFSPVNAATGTNRVPKATGTGSRGSSVLDNYAYNVRTDVPTSSELGPSAPAGPSTPAVNPIDAIFAPMFESLAQREQLANQRYEANREQVTNIYGQITGARSQDIAATGEAFRRLTDAASARSSAVNTSIDESEAARLRNNQAALESMGLGGLSTSQGDIASQGAAMAKNTNTLNAENWQNLLTAMGATSQDLARSDVTGFNYRMGEDIGQLRGAREGFQEDIGRERTSLLGQQGQARFDFQQAQQAASASAAAAAASATNAADRAAAKRAQDLLDSADPLTRATSRGIELGYANFDPVKVQDAYNGWMINRGTKPTAAGRTSWDRGSAIADAISYAGEQLSYDEKRALQEAIGNSY
jgi:hypothetical protein